MPVHERQGQLANTKEKLGLDGKTGARIEIQSSTDEDYEPQIALGDVYNPDWNIAPTTGANEVQTLRVQDAAGGTFTITYSGQTTAAIPFNASAIEVQGALSALSNVTPGDIRVSKAGTAGDHTYTLKFGGQLARENVAEITADITGLAAAVTVDTVTEGDSSPATNEVQTVTVVGAGGTYTLSGPTDTTAAIDFDADAADVQSALEATDDFAPGDVVVTQDGNVYTIEFDGTLAATDVAELTADATNLTDPTKTIATTTAGSAT